MVSATVESAGVTSTDVRLRVLLSYHYYSKVDLATEVPGGVPVMADSGAFSAAMLGASIDLDNYANWLKGWKDRIEVYANLDVIGDAKKTLANQKRLEDKGLRPLPVFHVNESWDYLEYYLENYDYVALGGLVPYAGRLNSIMPWLIKAFKMLPKGKGYHGFGVTGWTILRSFPWASVDSSSFGSGYRYGRVTLFSPVEGKIVTAALGDAQSCYRYKNLFRFHGFDWRDFVQRERNDRKKMMLASAVGYLRAEEWLRKRHEQELEIYLAIVPGDLKLLKGVTDGKHTLRDFRRYG